MKRKKQLLFLNNKCCSSTLFFFPLSLLTATRRVTLIGVSIVLQFESEDALTFIYQRLSQGRSIVIKAASGGLLCCCRDRETRCEI